MLEGSLDDFPLPDVLRLLALSAKTGTLTLAIGERHGRVELLDGRVREASADASALPLARRLLGAGAVPTEQLLAAIGDAPLTDLQLARRLVDADALPAARLAELLHEHTVDALFDLRRCTDGTFRFDSRADADRGPSALDLAVDVEEALEEVGRRLERWTELCERSGPSHGTVTIGRPDREHAEVALPPDAWSVLSLVDGRRTLADLAALTGQGEYRTRRAVAALVDEGVAVVGADGAAGPGERLEAAHQALTSRLVELGAAPAAGLEASPSTPEPRPAAASPTADPAADPDVRAPRRPAPATVAETAPDALRPAATATAAAPDGPPAAGDAAVRPLRPRAHTSRLRTDPTVDPELLDRLIEGVQAL